MNAIIIINVRNCPLTFEISLAEDDRYSTGGIEGHDQCHEPVSYTHLDVYKRQRLHVAKMMIMMMMISIGFLCALKNPEQ